MMAFHCAASATKCVLHCVPFVKYEILDNIASQYFSTFREVVEYYSPKHLQQQEAPTQEHQPFCFAPSAFQ